MASVSLKRKVPTLLRLVRQAGDEINADVADAAGAQPRDVRQRDRSRMQPPDRRAFLVHEGLHAQAHAIHAAAEQRFQNLVGDRARSAFDGDLGRRIHLEVVTNRLKDSLQLIGREHRRRAAAEINRIHLRSKLPPSSSSQCVSAAAISEHTCSTYRSKSGARKHARSKVAEAALGAAKRHRDVNSL